MAMILMAGKEAFNLRPKGQAGSIPVIASNIQSGTLPGIRSGCNAHRCCQKNPLFGLEVIWW